MPDSAFKRCLGCGYILEGLPENRCPECNLAFDPHDDRTFTLEARRRSGHACLALAAGAYMLFVTTYLTTDALAIGRTRFPWWATALTLVVMAASVVLEILALRTALRALTRPRHTIEQHGSFVAAASIGVLMICSVLGLVLAFLASC